MERFETIKHKIARIGAYVLLTFVLFSISAYAKDTVEEYVKPCFDSRGSYQEAYDISAETTGTPLSIDSTTRASVASKLLLLNSIIYGTDNFCGTESSEISSSTRDGVLTQLGGYINSTLISLPKGDTIAHLKSEWLPGDTNSVQAKSGYEFLKDDIQLDTLWSYSRNIAYILYVVVVIIIGFFIMFRKRLGGSTYVNIMNSIPNVVLGLILVTFSFAISGIVLDMGKLGINVVGNIITDVITEEPINISNIKEMFTTGMDVAAPEWKIGVPVAASAYVLSSAAEKFEAAGGIGEGTLWMLVINGIKLVARGVTIASLIVLAKYALIGLVIIYASVKLFIVIITTYIKIFLDVITAPFYILVGSIPGNTHLIGTWLKKMVTNVLVFILIFSIINFAWMIGLSEVLEGNIDFFTDSVRADIAPDWIITFKGILLITGYFFATSAPTLAESIVNLPKSKGVAEAIGGAKKSFSKVPIVGNLMSS